MCSSTTKLHSPQHGTIITRLTHGMHGIFLSLGLHSFGRGILKSKIHEGDIREVLKSKIHQGDIGAQALKTQMTPQAFAKLYAGPSRRAGALVLPHGFNARCSPRLFSYVHAADNAQTH